MDELDYSHIEDSDPSSDLSSSIDSDHLFPDSSPSSVEEPDAWADSAEDEVLLRRDFKTKNPVHWDSNPKKELVTIKKPHKITKLHKNLFKTNNRIKLSKHASVTVLVTTYNDIYVLRDGTHYDVINASYNVSDFVLLGDRMVCVSMKCGYMKEVLIETLECRDVGLGSSRGYGKILCGNEIYLLGDTLEKRDCVNYELIKSFKEDAVDFCLGGGLIGLLRRNKTIAFYDEGTNALLNVRKYEDKYFINRIFMVDGIFMALMAVGLRVCKEGKDADLFRCELLYAAFNTEYLYLCGDSLNGLKVVRIRDMRNVTPGFVSKYRVKNVTGLFCKDREVYFTHGPFISKIEFI